MESKTLKNRSFSVSSRIKKPPVDKNTVEKISVKNLVPPVRLEKIDETPSLNQRKLLGQLGINPGAYYSYGLYWAKIDQALKDEGFPKGDPVEFVPGSKIPLLLVSAALDLLDFEDEAVCELICRFHPSSRSAALVLLTSRLAASALGPALASVSLQKAVREVVKYTCTHLATNRKTDELLWLLRLCPEHFRPAAVSAHALFCVPDICAALLLEYATRDWDAQLATTMPTLAEDHLRELATLASMFFAHGGDDKPKYTEIALRIYNIANEALKFSKEISVRRDAFRELLEVISPQLRGHDAFLQRLSPQLWNAAQKLPPPDPDTLNGKDRSLFHKEWPAPAPLQFGRTPEKLREQLCQDTGITITSTGWWVMPDKLPKQWDGLLTYLRDAALLNPNEPELVKLAERAAKAATAALFPGSIPSEVAHIASDILDSWVDRLGDMGSAPELDQLRRALRDASSMMSTMPAPVPMPVLVSVPVAKPDEPAVISRNDGHPSKESKSSSSTVSSSSSS